jgi:two-component system nitrate/nitrite response regulator NarL
MGIFVVSKLDLYRELIASHCMGEGIAVIDLYSSLSEIPGESVGGSEHPMNIVLYVTSDSDPASLGITAFKSRFPESSIVALVSSVLPGSMICEIAACVDAAIPDDRSLKTLSSCLMVVQEGFRIHPADRGPVPMGDRLVADHNLRSGPSGPANDITVSTHSPVASSSFDNAIQRELSINRGEHAMAETARVKLSVREQEVLRLVRDGKSNKDIAKCLDIVESTVKVHLRGCLRKIGLQNRTQAAVWAMQNLSE